MARFSSTLNGFEAIGAPDVGREAPRVDVRIERRRGDHGQHFAVARIEGDGGADELVLDEVLLGAALQLEVDGEVDVVAGHRLLARRTVLRQAAAVAVVLPVLRAVAAAEVFVVHHLHAALAEEVARLEVLVVRQVLVVGLADEAHDVRGHRRVRIVAALHRLDVQLRKRHRLRLDRRDLRHVQILGDRNRTRVRNRFSFFETRLDLLRRHAEDVREEGDDFLAMRPDRPSRSAA